MSDPTLTPVTALSDKTVALSWLLRDVLAQGDPTAASATVPYLTFSRGRSRSGRGTRYFLVWSASENSHKFYAFSDREALAHAEAYLTKRGVK